MRIYLASYIVDDEVGKTIDKEMRRASNVILTLMNNVDSY